MKLTVTPKTGFHFRLLLIFIKVTNDIFNYVNLKAQQITSKLNIHSRLSGSLERRTKYIPVGI